MLPDPVLHVILIDTYKWLIVGRKRQHSMLYFHLKTTALRYNYLQGILTAVMLANFSCLKTFGFWCTDGIYSLNYMLGFPLLY